MTAKDCEHLNISPGADADTCDTCGDFDYYECDECGEKLGHLG